VINKKKLENVEYLNYFGTTVMMQRCISEIKSRICMAKAAFNRKKTLFTSKLDLHLKKELSKVVYSEYSFLWC
jgi:hypothetical protein